MSAAIIRLDLERHYRAYCKAIGYDPAAMPEPPVDPDAELAGASRAFLAVDEALNPWADGTLIAALAYADPITRGEIIRELEERANRK